MVFDDMVGFFLEGVVEILEVVFDNIFDLEIINH
jgi:hypothetical protein